MEVTISRTDTTLIAAIDGELDVDNGHVLTSTVGPTLAEGITELIIDMTNLGFIDSSGISRFVALRQSTIDAGGTFRLINLAPNVRRVFEITGLIETFGIDE